jgi:tRNA (mo5U34)-methyltransferase
MSTATVQEYAARFLADSEEFNRRAQELRLGDVSGLYWYHTIALPNGLVTPGIYDFRQTIAAFPFPADMRGMRVLDVGSATGFFAFEFERRGADVVSVELDSLHSIDRFPGQPIDQVLAQIEQMVVPRSVIDGFARNYTADELYFNLLEGPFRFCQKLLGSSIRRCYSSVYGLTPENTEGGRFDLVFMGDILLHTINPLQALAAVAPLCSGTLILSQNVPESADGKPAMLYVGGEDPAYDEVSWWWPNKPCLMQLLRKFGFRTVVDAGQHAGVMRPSGHRFERSIFHATR